MVVSCVESVAFGQTGLSKMSTNCNEKSKEMTGMRKRKSLTVVLSLALFLAVDAAFAGDGIGVELTTDFFSKYIWRGQNLSDDPVFQPGLTVSSGNLSVSVWGNMDLTSINGNDGDFSELDYSLDYSGSTGIEGLAYSIGLIYYDFPGTAVPDTTELYLGFSPEAPLNPSLAIYHDVDEAEGSYISLAFAHNVERIGELFGSPVAMELGASLGWGSGSYNKYYWGTDQSKLNDLTLSASFPFEAAGLTVVPSLNYVTLLSDDIRATDAYGTDSDFFYAGVGLVKGF